MKEITIKKCWKDLLKQYNDLDKTAETLLNIITNGAYVSFDGEKIEKLKAEIIYKFDQRL